MARALASHAKSRSSIADTVKCLRPSKHLLPLAFFDHSSNSLSQKGQLNGEARRAHRGLRKVNGGIECAYGRDGFHRCIHPEPPGSLPVRLCRAQFRCLHQPCIGELFPNATPLHLRTSLTFSQTRLRLCLHSNSSVLLLSAFETLCTYTHSIRPHRRTRPFWCICGPKFWEVDLFCTQDIPCCTIRTLDAKCHELLPHTLCPHV